MRSALIVVVATVLAVPALRAQDSMTARGRITAIGGSTVTVSVAGKDMIFAVDAKTEITARGATTKTQAAQAAGKAGTTISALLKVGDGVEVRYSNVDGKMLASSIRANQPVGAGGISSSKPVAMTTEGIVTAVTMSSLAIKSGDRAMTFVIDKATDVTARGASTLQRQKQAEGAKGLIITEIVRVGDTVTVSYHDMEGKMHAATVRVMPKK